MVGESKGQLHDSSYSSSRYQHHYCQDFLPLMSAALKEAVSIPVAAEEPNIEARREEEEVVVVVVGASEDQT